MADRHLQFASTADSLLPFVIRGARPLCGRAFLGCIGKKPYPVIYIAHVMSGKSAETAHLLKMESADIICCGAARQKRRETGFDLSLLRGAADRARTGTDLTPRDFKAVKALKQASKKPLFCLVFIEKPLFFSNSNFQFPKFSPRSRVGAKEQNQPRGIFSYGAVFLCFLPIFSLFSPQKGIN